MRLATSRAPDLGAPTPCPARRTYCRADGTSMGIRTHSARGVAADAPTTHGRQKRLRSAARFPGDRSAIVRVDTCPRARERGLDVRSELP
jgi:hypothetical protein